MENKKPVPQGGSGRPALSMDGMLVRQSPKKQPNTHRASPSYLFAALEEQPVADQQLTTLIEDLLQPEATVTQSPFMKTVVYSRKSIIIAACMALFSGLVLYGHITLSGHGNGVAKAASLTKQVAVNTARPATVVPDRTLVQDMNAVIASQASLSASASLIDLSSGKEYDAGNYSQQYTAASTSKLVAVFDYIHQVELGKATLTQKIQGSSAQDIIMRMIVYSDNNAWAKLNSFLSFKQEQSFVNSLGITATIQLGNLQFSTPNMAKMLELLYQGKLMNSTNQAMVYGYMSHTTITNLIQAVLPSDATVYHKYGQVNGVLHDASIVEYHGHQFVLVIYTNNPAGTTALSAQQVSLIHAITIAAFSDVTNP